MPEAVKDIGADAAIGPSPRLSPGAIDRARAVFGTSDIEKLGALLGFSRAGWYRARVGLSDPRLSDARRVAQMLTMTVDEVFIGGRDA